MAEYSRRIVYPRPRVEYYLRRPSNWAELGKMKSAVENETARLHITPYDDTVTVDANDDEVVMSFEMPEPNAGKPLNIGELVAKFKADWIGFEMGREGFEEVAEFLGRHFTVLPKAAQ